MARVVTNSPTVTTAWADRNGNASTRHANLPAPAIQGDANLNTPTRNRSKIPKRKSGICVLRERFCARFSSFIQHTIVRKPV